jgi:hypothetical protein
MSGDYAYHCIGCYFVFHGKYQYHCRGCQFSSDMFGCVGLQNKKFCIFNKQYTEKEYNELLPRLIEKMKQEGDYGQFFSPALSPHGYNETVAMENFPLTREEVLAKGWKWQDELPGTYGQETLQEIPDDINNVTDEILKEILACINCGKNFKIISQELEFYRNRSIALPDQCPNCRYADRAKLRNPYKFWGRQCGK